MARPSVLIALLMLFLAPLRITAQELLQPEELFEEPAADTHAGLLGKRYVQAMYRHYQLNDAAADFFDDTLQGFDTRLNLPVLKMGQFGKFGVDAFAGYGRLTMGGSAAIGPPINLPASFHAEIDSYYAGATLYTTAFETIRPFAQLGAAYTENSANFALGPFGFRETDYDTEFRFILGTEADLTSFAALRLALDVETQESFGDSGIATELILWPLEKVFVRGGFITPLDGDGIGGTIGAGFQF